MILLGCAVIETAPLGRDHGATQAARLAAAHADLMALESVDVLVRLDNAALHERLQGDMEELADIAEVVDFQRVRVQFTRQYIALEARARLADDAGAVRSARLEGDIELRHATGRLVWRPQFTHIAWTGEPEARAESGADAGTVSAPPAELLERLNAELAWNLHGLDRYYLEIDPLALGELHAGATMAQASDVVGTASLDLGGVFTTQGSAVLIEPSTTHIALDLEFVSSAFACPADVSVSRSMFTRAIRDREPVLQNTLLQGPDEIRHYFTEITGARESTAVVHYWFADGQPATVAELAVEPSARWRTWSSRPEGQDAVRRWEVLVVERDSGCILETASAFTDFGLAADSSRETAQDPVSFDDYRARFLERVATLEGPDDAAATARIDVDRRFFASVLEESLRDQELMTHLVVGSGSPERYQAGMAAFDPGRLRCDRPQCETSRECVVDYDACPVERDNRDCTSCLFRNPLNNRCVNEGEDPICAAVKAAQNARLERNREACVRNAQEERDACERLKTQQVRSCELEASTEISACQSRLALVRDLRNAGTVATVHGQASLSGDLDVTFHGFRLEANLAALRMDISLRANLAVEGEVNFVSLESLGALSACVDQWQGRFQARIVLPRWRGGLINQVQSSGSGISSQWSGFVQTADMSPSPLEALFLASPGRLADCQLGLGVGNVSSVLTGPQSGFFRGNYDFAIQPLPTEIRFHPASITINGTTKLGRPSLEEARLVYIFDS